MTFEHVSIVRQSTRAARRTVILAFAGAMLVVGALVAERILFQGTFADAADSARRAVDVAGDIMLADERLTMSAHMAASSGEERWIERYEASIPAIDRAIETATKLAPPAVAARFDAETRVANDLLVEMERRAFALVREGRLVEARALLDGPR